MTYCRKLWLFVVAGMQILRAPMGTSAAENPCPDLFWYEGGHSSEYGIIIVPNPYPYLAIDISVAMYVTAPVPSNSPTKLQPADRNMWTKLVAGSRDPVVYRLVFPVTSPLPTIKSITVNQNIICSGTKPNVRYLTTVTVQHSIFNDRCNSASLKCPFNAHKFPRTRQQPSPPLPPQPEDIGTNTRCGRVVRTNEFIINGQGTAPGQWPWHVALYFYQGNDMVYRCGGSFVRTRYIITAASCVTTRNGEKMPPKNFTVFLGRNDLTDYEEDDTQQKDVQDIFVHYGYNGIYLDNDIAMLVLNSSVEVTAQVRPVCLWDQSDTSLQSVIGKDGVVVGWGLDEKGVIGDKLKMVKMPVVSQDTCIKNQVDFFSRFTHEATFCAGFGNGSIVCNGDSGSGMVFPEIQSGGRQIWKLRGLVSNSRPDDYNIRRCDIKNYIVFTDIAQYMEWIDVLTI